MLGDNFGCFKLDINFGPAAYHFIFILIKPESPHNFSFLHSIMVKPTSPRSSGSNRKSTLNDDCALVALNNDLVNSVAVDVSL
jgi:hypothetical protein